jgi:hypothetical protein
MTNLLVLRLTTPLQRPEKNQLIVTGDNDKLVSLTVAIPLWHPEEISSLRCKAFPVGTHEGSLVSANSRMWQHAVLRM